MKDEANKWWLSLDYKQFPKLSDEEFEKFILDKWSHAGKQDNEKRGVIFYWYLLITGSWKYSEGEDHCVYKS